MDPSRQELSERRSEFAREFESFGRLRLRFADWWNRPAFGLSFLAACALVGALAAFLLARSAGSAPALAAAGIVFANLAGDFFDRPNVLKIRLESVEKTLQDGAGPSQG